MTFRVFYLFFCCFFSRLFNSNRAERIAFQGLIQPHTYRINESEQNDFLSVFRYFKRSIDTLRHKQKPQFCSGNPHKAMFRGTYKSFGQGYDYLKAVTSDPPAFHVSRDSLKINNHFFFKFQVISAILILSFLLFPVSLFVRRKASFGLILLELTECCLVLKIFKMNKVNYVYFFEAFEKDSNFIAVVLQYFKIKVHKIPSPNPLSNFYKMVVSDCFSFTVPYQKNEYEKLKNNWIVSEIFAWPFPGYQELLKYCLDVNQEKYEYDLGFISSGVWLRRQRENSLLGIGESESEEMLIFYINEFLKKNPEITFAIYLHPIEKSTPEFFLKAKEYYSNIFGERVNFFDYTKPSNNFFNKANIAIAAYSSTNIERLFCGYKTFYAPFLFKKYPFEGTVLDNISIKNQQELEVNIIESLQIKTDDFFKKYKIEEYCFKGIKKY